ncbi:MAG: AAA family ATPase, partial [Burkholderiales bacterium]|nr:AAA family ATPase [Burkholderiales bacterium]
MQAPVRAVDPARPPVSPAAFAGALETAIARVFTGHAAAVRTVLAALIAGGHVLIEDVPGTGKTTLAKALAAALDTPLKRVQFTPDLLPS